MSVDVCLISEGSYPYVTGGTGNWLHQLIHGLSDLRFALVTILPSAGPRPADRYPLPANVIERQDLSLFGTPNPRGEPRAELLGALDAFHQASGRCPFTRLVGTLGRSRRLAATSLLTSRASWDLLQELYRRRRRDVSLLDYFWTWQATHGPVFRLLDAPLPEARVYHSISTGYAGLLAALGKIRSGAGMAITEHGLYTREREIELAQSNWIYHEPATGTAFVTPRRFFKDWWLRQYRFLGQMGYDLADRVIALHEENHRLQLAAGTPASRLAVVPNGIDASRFRGLRAPRDWQDRPFRFGLLGRVVPIKDIKTYLRAVQLIRSQRSIEAFVLGPTDEDPAYFAECQELAAQLGLEDTVRFTGPIDILEWLPRLDLNVLSSLSEAQPLALLEASSSGIPTVATDVGACREMLRGHRGADAALGPSGRIVPVASPEALATAILEVARDPAAYAAMARAGIERVERYYRIEDVLAYYRQLYQQLAAPQELVS